LSRASAFLGIGGSLMRMSDFTDRLTHLVLQRNGRSTHLKSTLLKLCR
jgi:hypothetical protein